MAAKAALSFLVRAVQQHPCVDRPVLEFIGCADTQQHDWQVCDCADNGVNELTVGGPGPGVLRDPLPGQGGGGFHEFVPVQDGMAW